MAEQNKQKTNPEHKPDGSPPFYTRTSWWIAFALALFVVQLFLYRNLQPKDVMWSAFKTEMLANGDVQKMTVVNEKIAEIYIKEDRLGTGRYEAIQPSHPGPHFKVSIGSVSELEALVNAADAASDEHIDLAFQVRTNWLANILGWLIPLGLIILLWFWLLKRFRPGGGIGGKSPFDFGKSTATLFEGSKETDVNFDDVAGLEEAKIEIKEIVDFLKNPDTFTRLGAKIPKGIILVGPPGTGKTLLAKAVAGEAKVPFFSLSGSAFVEMFVGVGASRVRDLFKKAKEKAPSIIFIDEIDAIGRSRSKAFSLQPNDERESTLNQLLTELDGFDNNTGVIVLAATNRADILDRALLRPGRFDRHIYLELPTRTEREAIFKVHLKPLKLAEGIDIESLSLQTPGFSGADIANICNEAALIAARKGKDAVEMEDFFSATDRVIAGLEKKSKIISPKEKEIIAFHEAGHATVSWFLEHTDTLMKVTIVPRGKSLGAAWYLPEEHLIYTKAQFIDRICAALGGRAAEDLIFKEVSSGALDDLEKVTKQAYTMVAYYGLDESIGNLSYYDSTGQSEQSLQKPYSEATAELIDKAVRKLVADAYKRTKDILKIQQPKLEELARLLMEKEVVVKEDMIRIFGERIKTQHEPILFNP